MEFKINRGTHLSLSILNVGLNRRVYGQQNKTSFYGYKNEPNKLHIIKCALISHLYNYTTCQVFTNCKIFLFEIR